MNVDVLALRLEELGTELKVRDRPERRAWNRLAPNRHGWTTRPYEDRAFELWGEVLRRFPEDLHSVHHLAIAYHARAIDVEQSDHPDRSVADWRRALLYWHRLFEAEEFWSELSARVDATPDPVPQVRRELAERLLRMHFDIGLDEQSPHHRARFHIRLALDSPFPRELVEDVRLQAYERAIADLDGAVWRDGTIEAETLLPAIQTVIRYLELDDDCAAALNDLLRLLIRLQAGRVQQANGIADPDEMRPVLKELRDIARRYDAYISRLESLLLEAADPDDLALCDVALWHSRAGQACRLTDAYDEAARHYGRAFQAAHVGADSQVEELRAEWSVTTALAAREHAADNAERALELLAPFSEFDRLPVLALVLRAQTRLILGDLVLAGEDAAEAMSALDSPHEDLDYLWGEDPAELRDACRNLQVQIRRARLAEEIAPHMDEAEQAVRAGRWADAVTALNTALRIDRVSVPALVLRAQCHMGQYETADAEKDLGRAERLARMAGDTQALKAMGQVRSNLRGLHADVTAYGGPEAFRLRQAGINAFNEGRHEVAVDLLRSARGATRSGAAQKHDEDLAHCLNAAACGLVEPIAKSLSTGGYRADSLLALLQDNGLDDRQLFPGWPAQRASLPGGAPPSSLLSTVHRAEDMLTEAVSLASSRRFSENLAQVRELRRRLAGDLW